MQKLRNDIVLKAREYVNTPWHHQGRQKGVGVDCIGLIVCVAKDLGYEVQDFITYTLSPDCKLLLKKLSKHLKEIEISESEPGDIFLISIYSRTQHVAIKTDKGIIHAYRQAKKVVETSLNAYWQNKIVKAFCFPRLPNG